MKIKFVILQTLLLGLFVIGLWAIESSDRLLHLFVKPSAQPRLGRVNETLGDVRRRSSKELMWIPVSKGDGIFAGDVFYTGPSSNARLELQRNTRIRILEDSLLRIERQGEVNVVDLKGGSIGVQSEEGEKIGFRQDGRMVPTVLPKQEMKVTKPRLAQPEFQHGLEAKLREGQKDAAPSSSAAKDGEESEDLKDGPKVEIGDQDKAIEPEVADEKKSSSFQWNNPLVLIFCALYAVVILLSILDQLRTRKN